MKINGKRIVLDAPDGITVQVQEGAEKIVIKVVEEEYPICSDQVGNYKEPVVPKGYVHLTGEWDTGFVIQNMVGKSEFVWIPVGYLDPDGTLDGKNFCEKFGRRYFYNSDFSDTGYHEEVNPELVASVKKYGGFYISRYHASLNQKGKLVFRKWKKRKLPWNNITYYDAKAAAEDYAKESKDVESQITSGAAFDSMLCWILKSGAKTHEEVVEDSTSWGNFWDVSKSQLKIMPPGSNENWCVCNIYDIAGNVSEWTSEEYYRKSIRVLRGGDLFCNNIQPPAAAYRTIYNFCNHSDVISFRVMLYIK